MTRDKLTMCDYNDVGRLLLCINNLNKKLLANLFTPIRFDLDADKVTWLLNCEQSLSEKKHMYRKKGSACRVPSATACYEYLR